MIFAALLLLSPLPLFGDAVLPVTNSTRLVAEAPVIAAPVAAAPESLTLTSSAPAAPAAEISAVMMPRPKANGAGESSSAEPRAFAFEPIKPATQRSFDNHNQKKIWYGLVATGHAGAAFDAWSTRRALSGNWGTEADPLMRPFAHSGAIYVATQVGPAVMDFIGKRAMTSEHIWVRRLWWVPQSVGAGMSFRAGVHNVGVVH